MFDTDDMARRYFAEHFQRSQIEFLVEALEPSIQFIAVGRGALAPGSSRIGGAPDLPAAIAWPTPKFPPNIADIVTRGSPEANKDLKQHVALRPPYAFFAQVDLTEAKALGRSAADLPDYGRLLFFYDLVVGPYDAGAWTAQVIWDRSPAEALMKRPLPDQLKTASDERRRADAASDEEIRKEYGEDAVQRSADSGTPYDGPARAMRLKATFRPPAAASIELGLHPTLKAELARPSVNYEETFSDRYGDMFAKRFDPFYGASNRGNRNQLLGDPLPEQSDPRNDAVVATEYGGRRLDPAEWDRRSDEIDVKARDWRLLLQIDVADWMQSDGEGTVYFLIRAADLKERRFDRVVAVYQQT